MAAISLRLPDEVETLLATEAEREGRSRSEIVREAITDYVTRRERERFMAEVVTAANAIGEDSAASAEARALADATDDQALDDDDVTSDWWR
ncbi:Ribbon-helix-helix protein, copG family [Modicisalibacter ilicicola DSM 19980]|uniref:Ribbon-helix-helix protein, copG family n=1 Tax=Modicisalibacter ilicicola DSM 19980 TaxID=1121942 RepID=A0A1M4WIA9_9GAMM|nr:ribbon-helix-helix protein, CopG family [Halomonas ilicicola]SHE80793.1 Ribbon-helix-helix protein, copG family [Halomonas ilicicola DSM 19980]